MSNREDLFKKAAQKRAEEKQQEQSRGQGGYTNEYDDIAYVPLATDQDRIFRMIGTPPTMRENVYDPKIVTYSYIVADNGNRSRVFWPSKEDNPTWVLWKIYDLVMKYKWDNTKNERMYLNQKTHPDIFNRVFKNGKMESNYETGWKPKDYVMANVIDRHDPEWHKENQHTKLLSKKASQMQNGDFFYEPGIPYYAFKIIWDDVVEYNGDWENYDISLRKVSGNPFYKAFHGVHDLMKLSNDVKSFVVDEYLTEEEEGYEKYDIDKLFKVTSYTKIKRILGVFIQQVDAAFGTNFYSELLKEVEKEEAERQTEAPEDSSTQEAPKATTSKEEVTEEKPKRATRTPKKETSSIDWDSLADGTFNGTEYAGVSKMTDEEKSMVVSVKEDGSFEYVPEWEGESVRLLESESSSFVSPEQFHVDPLSGEEF